MKALLLFFVMAVGSPAFADGSWVADPGASRLQFVVSYEGQETVGEFHQFKTTFSLHPDDPVAGILDVQVDIASADMDSEDLNAEILKPEWFAADRFPRARFHSETLRSTGGDQFVASGTLELKGVKKAIDVPFSWSAGHGGGQARLDGKLVLQRTDFDIGAGEWASDETIATAVKVRFHLQLVPAGGDTSE